tara:strand:- start:187 stop:330 length:144 start_codon:yes stop_codon:yes gene_type:complete
MLFEVPALDPVTWSGVAGVVCCSCLTAAYLPARRAAQLDPVVLLRAD